MTGADELLGRPSHETIHYRHPDGTPHPAADCPMLLPRATGETVARDLDWFVRRDGSMFPVSYVSVPIELPEGRGAVVAFTDIEDRVRAERSAARLRGDRSRRTRRIATLAAGGAASADVFAAIAREVGHVDRPPAGRGVALRARRGDGDRGRRLERASASVPGRHPLAARCTDHLRPGPGDRSARRGSTTSRTSPARSPTPPARPGSARAPAPRSSSTATSGARCRPTRPIANPCPTTSRIGSPSSPSWSPRRSRTPRAGPVSLGWPRSRRRCGASRRWPRAGRRRRSCSLRLSRRSGGCFPSRTWA